MKPKPILFTLLALTALAALAFLAVDNNLGGWFGTPSPIMTNISMPTMTATQTPTLTPTLTSTATRTPVPYTQPTATPTNGGGQPTNEPNPTDQPEG